MVKKKQNFRYFRNCLKILIKTYFDAKKYSFVNSMNFFYLHKTYYFITKKLFLED